MNHSKVKYCWSDNKSKGMLSSSFKHNESIGEWDGVMYDIGEHVVVDESIVWLSKKSNQEGQSGLSITGSKIFGNMSIKSNCTWSSSS